MTFLTSLHLWIPVLAFAIGVLVGVVLDDIWDEIIRPMMLRRDEGQSGEEVEGDSRT